MTINLYPNIKKFALEVATSNGIINRLEPEAEFLTQCEQALFADGVYIEDVGAFESWLSTLTAEQFEAFCDGDQLDVEALIQFAPKTSEGTSVATLLDDVFGF